MSERVPPSVRTGQRIDDLLSVGSVVGLADLRQRHRHLRGSRRTRRGCIQPAGGQGRFGCGRVEKQFDGRLAFCGNVDVRILEAGDPSAIEREVRYKLQAGRNGGYVFQSDHSISSEVAPESYEMAIAALRRFSAEAATD